MLKYELQKLKTTDRNINVFKAYGSCPAHTHEFVELVYVYSGACTQYVDDRAYETAAGDLLLINYGQSHTIVDHHDALYYNIEYTPDFFGRELMNSENLYDIFEYLLLDDEAGESRFPLVHISFSGSERERVEALLADMYAELSRRRLGYRNILYGYSRVLFSHILRRASSERMPDQVSVGNIVEKCIAYIDQNYFEKLTLDEIAQSTNYNPSYLSRIFKRYCGRNLWDYLKEKRIEEGARLLSETAESVERVMEKVGYFDKKRFYRDFAAQYGETPAQYRAKSKNSLPE